MSPVLFVKTNELTQNFNYILIELNLLMSVTPKWHTRLKYHFNYGIWEYLGINLVSAPCIY